MSTLFQKKFKIYKNYINNLKLQIEKLKGKVDYKSFSLLVELQIAICIFIDLSQGKKSS